MKVDKDEFIKIIGQNNAILNKICFGYTNNTEDRNDLKQDILIQLWKAYQSFQHQSQISTWIYRIALNTAITNFRVAKRKIKESPFSTGSYQVPDTNESKELDDNIARLYQLIQKLNDLDKAIMLLYLDDQSYKDIAEIVGISETNVATKINRIKLKLRNQFNNN
jgi:RNA polymerase sigma factor (sigma-70 family)